MVEHLQDKYLRMCVERGMFLGDYDARKVSNLPAQWFWERRCEIIDFRGDLQIRSAENITFGYGVKILTASHLFLEGGVNPAIEYKKCWIDDAVFVGSFALLYNCHLMHHAVVACGAVVRNTVVPPHCMVEGNPARIVKMYRDGAWRRV